jgi:glycerophosphoryl diester phosphodiesterase
MEKTMIFVAHRGLVNGKDSNIENKPETIDNAINLGFDAEIDLRLIDGKFYLGHDEDKLTFIDFDFILTRKSKLWVHAKNYQAFDFLHEYKKEINYFWHTEDDFTLTSFGYSWIYPGKAELKNGIMVMPEYYMDYKNAHKLPVSGICSDHILEIRENYFNT